MIIFNRNNILLTEYRYRTQVLTETIKIHSLNKPLPQAMQSVTRPPVAKYEYENDRFKTCPSTKRTFLPTLSLKFRISTRKRRRRKNAKNGTLRSLKLRFSYIAVQFYYFYTLTGTIRGDVLLTYAKVSWTEWNFNEFSFHPEHFHLEIKTFLICQLYTIFS